MQPTTIPDLAKAARPWAEEVVVGPPIDDTLGCVPVKALVGRTDDEGTTFRIPWTPDEDDLRRLSDGEPVWLTLWCPQMPPVDLHVGPA